MALEIYGRYPTVPEYYQAFIDKTVDLTSQPKQCCPFHKEDTPSFSYDGRTGKWSCFGACHALGRDVIDMHMRWFKYKTKDDAEDDLARRCKVDRIKQVTLEPENIFVNQKKVDLKVSLLQALQIAKNTKDPEEQARRYIELDEIMSKYPISEDEIYNLYIKWE